jgi:cyclase
VEAIRDGHADAVLVAGILHDGITTVYALKDAMRAANLEIRVTGVAA